MSMANVSPSAGNAMGELYKALWRFAEGARGHLLGATALLTGSQLMRLTMPWLAAQAINASTVIGLRLSAASRKLLGKRMDAISAPLKRTVVLNEGKWFSVDVMGLALTWGLVVVYVWQTRLPGQTVMLGSVS